MLNENQVYLALKQWLHKEGWLVVGGEPPGGTNDIPVVEMKNATHTMKGSKGSRKIDLVAFRDGYFLLIECKPSFSKSDVDKLNEVVSQKKWRAAFVRAVTEKRIAQRLLLTSKDLARYVDQPQLLIKAVGFSQSTKKGPEDFITLCLTRENVIPYFGRKIPDVIRKLF
ncbi:MAG: hypothetical protein QXG05_02400 [Nitrososphaerota archaeon]